MSNFRINRTRIRLLQLPNNYDEGEIIIGIPVMDDENVKLGLSKINDSVLPSMGFGSACKKNALGYSYSDRTQPKQYRYITTIWMQPWGNPNASSVPVDIHRYCYPKITVPPTEIELVYVTDVTGNKYIVADLNREDRQDCLVGAINVFLEIYGFCYVYSSGLEVPSENRHRCNWEILPPGENPSAHLKQQLQNKGKPPYTFDVSRLESLESLSPELIVEGINGFSGYYAYVFSSICVLESAFYGNATYIIPKEDWGILSQKTKKALLDNNQVMAKTIHTAAWQTEIRETIRRFESIVK